MQVHVDQIFNVLEKVAQAVAKEKYAEPFVIINSLNHSKTVDVFPSINKNFRKKIVE